MKLSATVIKIESGVTYKDKENRVTLRFNNAESWQCEITIHAAVLNHPKLNELFEFEAYST